MDAANKIALGVVGAAALLLFGFIGYREYARQRDINEMQEALQGVVQVGQRVMAESAAQTRAWRAQQVAKAQADRVRQAVESARYDLAPDQRCVGGVVLEVRGNVYTQVGSIAQPVHCTGRRADRPLR